MKKNVVAISALIVLSAAAVFADGFKVHGFLRAGYSTPIKTSDAGDTATWLGGDFFGGTSRSCLNISFDNKNNTAGAFALLRWDGDMTEWVTTDGYPQTKAAYGYVSLFNKKLTFAAGILKDKWVNSTGFEGYSVLNSAPGAVVVFSPVKGLNIAGGMGARYCNYKQSDKSKTALGGVKYTNKMFSVAANGTSAGVIYGNLNIMAVKGLAFTSECQYASKDAIKTATSDTTVKACKYPYKSVLDEQLKFTGIDKLMLGFLSYQYVNSYTGLVGSVKENSNWKITLTPAMEYDFTAFMGVTLESTYTMYSSNYNKNNYFTVTPSLKLSADKLGTVNLWGTLSTDEDQAVSCAGIGVIKKF